MNFVFLYEYQSLVLLFQADQHSLCSESRDVRGRVVGSYQYLDPLKRVVRVDYTADKSGFYPTVQGAVPDALPKVGHWD